MNDIVASILVPALSVALLVGVFLVLFLVVGWAAGRFLRPGEVALSIKPARLALARPPEGSCVVCGARLARPAAALQVISDLERQIESDTSAIASLLNQPARQTYHRLYVA